MEFCIFVRTHFSQGDFFQKAKTIWEGFFGAVTMVCGDSDGGSDFSRCVGLLQTTPEKKIGWNSHIGI